MALLSLVLFANGAQAIVLDFEGLPPGANPGQPTIPNGYGGFNWSGDNLRGLDPTINSTINNSGYGNGLISGAHVGIFRSGATLTAQSGTFQFNSGYFTAAWHDDLNLLVTGLAGGVQLFQTALTLQTSGPVLATLNWAGIDTLTFASSGGTHAGLGGSGPWVAMDDLTINAAPPSVTEPWSMALLMAGLVGLGFTRRIRR